MTPDEADKVEAEHRHAPTSAREHGRWQGRWRAWCAKRGLDPDRAGAALVAAWLAQETNSAGQPLVGEAAASGARAVDAMPGRRGLPPVRRDPAVKPVVDAARRAAAGSRRPEPPPLTPQAARVLLAVPPPAPTQSHRDARLVLATAVRGRLPLRNSARAADGLDARRRKEALRMLASRGAAPGAPSHDRPWLLPRPLLLALWHQIDKEGFEHARVRAGVALGWHCALEPADLEQALRGHLRLSRNGLALDLPGGTVYARRADDPGLCAIRPLRLYLRAAGPLADDAPLFCAPGPDGPRPVPTATWNGAFERAAARAGMSALRLHSLRLGYAVAADGQGASVPAIAAGMRVANHGHVQTVVERQRHRAITARTPSR